MLGRCNYPSTNSYKTHGGRGITICDDWLDDFRNFLSDMGECPEGLSLERNDNDGNYEPSNCRWATKKEQARNRRSNHNLTLKGETHCMVEWAKITGIKRATIAMRILKYGWSVEDALTIPAGGRSSRPTNRRLSML